MASNPWGSWGDFGSLDGDQKTPKKTVAQAVESVEKLVKPKRIKEDRYIGEDARKDAWRAACDSEFWVALYFSSREQKEAFLIEAGIADLGDKYLDGREVARRAEIDIPADPPPRASRRRGSRWDRFVR